MVKLIQIILLLFVITSCAQIKNKNILLGKWQLIATNESDGAKPHTNEVKNGEIINFQDRNLLNNEKGEKGTYQLENDHLKLSLAVIRGNICYGMLIKKYCSPSYARYRTLSTNLR